MTIVLLAILAFFLFGDQAYGWGLMTHVELAQSLLIKAAAIATTAGGLLLRHKRDFLLGNLLADVIIGKNLSRRRKDCHDWTAGLRLLENAHDDRTKAFAYGFIAHLAADTVAHNQFIPKQILQTGSTVNLGHLYWELMADQRSDPSNRRIIRRLLKEPSLVHEQLLETHLHPSMKWYGFNRSVFANLSRLTHGRHFNQALKICSGLSLFPLRDQELDPYKTEALDRMIDVVTHGKNSLLLCEDPNGRRALREIREKRKV